MEKVTVNRIIKHTFVLKLYESFLLKFKWCQQPLSNLYICHNSYLKIPIKNNPKDKSHIIKPGLEGGLVLIKNLIYNYYFMDLSENKVTKYDNQEKSFPFERGCRSLEIGKGKTKVFKTKTSCIKNLFRNIKLCTVCIFKLH